MHIFLFLNIEMKSVALLNVKSGESVRADLTGNTVLTQLAISLDMDKINGSVLLWDCSFSGSLCSFCY